MLSILTDMNKSVEFASFTTYICEINFCQLLREPIFVETWCTEGTEKVSNYLYLSKYCYKLD